MATLSGSFFVNTKMCLFYQERQFHQLPTPKTEFRMHVKFLQTD